MQHQFWITKKTVERKLGSKEDDYIVSSDAVLDAKIEILKSISETSFYLNKIIDQSQERLCILSQEECIFGKFLKEVGKRSKTTGPSITNTGRAILYCGQQRMCLRVPLMRLQHEVDVFRCRAVSDTQNTINNMEKVRTEYRAALCWMKSASSELDPDAGKGLDKFRKAQFHVRLAKQDFDRLSLDSIQKIDLLSAARCNMFSHVLVSYMASLLLFSKKTASTLESISNALLTHPRYDFSILKELSQIEIFEEDTTDISAVGDDQTLYFVGDKIQNEEKLCGEGGGDILIELSQNAEIIPHCNSVLSDIYASSKECSNLKDVYEPSKTKTAMLSLNPCLKKVPNKDTGKRNYADIYKKETPAVTAWFDLFSDLDPFANPESYCLKLYGNEPNFQKT